MIVKPVRVGEKDNYAYLIIDEHSKQAVAVDIFDVAKVRDEAKAEDVSIVAAITTHHHPDHSDGNLVFAEKYRGAPIYAGSIKAIYAGDENNSSKFPKETVKEVVKDKQEFDIADNLHFKCFATPCHTEDSICFYVTDSAKKSQPGAVFTGDTLFQGGCGRFFWGTGEQMHAALSYLGELPNETIVYNGHEYTAENLKFAKAVDPTNPGIARLAKLVEDSEVTAGRSTIGDEKEWNVFMRLDSQAVKNATSGATGESAIMDRLRDMKNEWGKSKVV